MQTRFAACDHFQFGRRRFAALQGIERCGRARGIASHHVVDALRKEGIAQESTISARRIQFDDRRHRNR